MTSKIHRVLLGTIVAGIGLAGAGPARGDMVYAAPATTATPEAGATLGATVFDPLGGANDRGDLAALGRPLDPRDDPSGMGRAAVATTPGAAILLIDRPEGADLLGPGMLDPVAGPVDLAAALADDPNSWDIDHPGALGAIDPMPGAARVLRRPGPRRRAAMDVVSPRAIVLAEPPAAILLGVGMGIVALAAGARRHRDRPIAGLA